jgi:hypothetical protein
VVRYSSVYRNGVDFELVLNYFVVYEDYFVVSDF